MTSLRDGGSSRLQWAMTVAIFDGESLDLAAIKSAF